jgi:RNA polymerase sigma-70 factor (ECF subfamily)
MKDPDQPLLDEIRAGNSHRFGALVDRHKDRALTLAVRLVGNKEEAEELVQDSFIRAYRNLVDFRGDSRFGTWFYRILYNLCMTKVTRKTNVAMVPWIEVPDLGAPEEETDSLREIEQREMQSILREEIRRLPEAFAAAITLFYVQEMTYDEIAAVTGLPLGTVKTNLFRGRQALRQRMVKRVGEEIREP